MNSRFVPMMLTILKWIGTGAGIAGALLVASNVPASGWGFVLFLLSSMAWTTAGIQMREPSIWVLNLAFTSINVLGIVRWLL